MYLVVHMNFEATTQGLVPTQAMIRLAQPCWRDLRSWKLSWAKRLPAEMQWLTMGAFFFSVTKQIIYFVFIAMNEECVISASCK